MLKLDFFIILTFVFVCVLVCVCVCVYEYVHTMCATYTCDRVLDSLGAEVTGKCELPKTVMASKLGSSYKEATLLTTKSTEGLEDVQSYTLFFSF